jgi:hypothetical protein
VKRVLRVLAVGIGLGLLLVFLQQGLQVDSKAFLRWYWAAGAAVLAALALAGQLYYRKYRREMLEAAKLLEEGKTGEYLEKVEKLLEGARGRQLQNQLRINLTAGYCRQGEYGRAAEILEGLEGEKLRGVMKMVQRLNLCCCYFYTGQWGRGMELYGRSQGEFAPYRGGEAYGGNVAVLDIFAAIGTGERGRAGELLREARRAWQKPGLEEHYRYLAGLLEQGK